MGDGRELRGSTVGAGAGVAVGAGVGVAVEVRVRVGDGVERPVGTSAAVAWTGVAATTGVTRSLRARSANPVTPATITASPSNPEAFTSSPSLAFVPPYRLSLR